MPRYKVDVIVSARSAREARALVTPHVNPSKSFAFARLNYTSPQGVPAYQLYRSFGSKLSKADVVYGEGPVQGWREYYLKKGWVEVAPPSNQGVNNPSALSEPNARLLDQALRHHAITPAQVPHVMQIAGVIARMDGHDLNHSARYLAEAIQYETAGPDALQKLADGYESFGYGEWRLWKPSPHRPNETNSIGARAQAILQAMGVQGVNNPYVQENPVRYSVVEEDGYVKIRHPKYGTVAAATIGPDGKLRNIEFTEERYRKINAIRIPAMDALIKWQKKSNPENVNPSPSASERMTDLARQGFMKPLKKKMVTRYWAWTPSGVVGRPTDKNEAIRLIQAYGEGKGRIEKVRELE